MLRSLTDIKVDFVNQRKPVAELPTIGALEAMMDFDFMPLASSEVMDQDRLDLQTQRRTINELVALKHSIQRHGLTRSLVSFANHNGILSGAIPQIPAVEQLLSDRSVNKSQDVVAAIEVQIGLATTVFWRTLKARMLNMINIFRSSQEHLSSLTVKMNVLKHMIDEGRSFDEDAARTKKISLLDFGVLKEKLDALPHVEQALTKIVALGIPIGSTQSTTWMQTFIREVNALTPITGLFYNERGSLKHTQDTNRPKFASLLDHGYTSLSMFDTLLEMIPHVDMFQKHLFSHINNLEKFVTQDHDRDTDIENDHFVHQEAEDLMNFIFSIYQWSTSIGYVQLSRAMRAMFYCTIKTPEHP